MQLEVGSRDLVLEESTTVKPKPCVHLDDVHHNGSVRHVDQDKTMPTAMEEMSVTETQEVIDESHTFTTSGFRCHHVKRYTYRQLYRQHDLLSG